MNKIQVYQSDGGLGYRQLAFLILLGKTKDSQLGGDDYLCIGTQNINDEDSEYQIGNVVKDLEDIYITESTYKIEESPLYGTFLFDYYLQSQKLN